MKRLENTVGYPLLFVLLGSGVPDIEPGAAYSPGAYNINRVENPGFEYLAEADGSYGDIPKYWNRSIYSGSHSTFYLTGSSMHGGYACAISDTSSTVAAGLETDDIPVVPGYVYQAGVWARRNSADVDAGATLYLRWYDENGLIQISIS